MEITVQELKHQIDSGDDPFLLDVREEFERDIVNIGGMLIPMNQISDRLDEIEEYRDKPIVVYCRSGSRSAQIVRLLRDEGFEGAINLKGGVSAWAAEIDPTLPRY